VGSARCEENAIEAVEVFCVLRPRSLSEGQIYTLLGIYQYTALHCPKNGWVSIQENLSAEFQRNREHQRLRFWGLLEPHPVKGKRTKDNSKGVYKLTWEGAQFVEGCLRVPRKLLFVSFEDRVQERSEEEVDIHDVLGYTFNYQSLIQGGGGAIKVQVGRRQRKRP
jgi:hypothetical protein